MFRFTARARTNIEFTSSSSQSQKPNSNRPQDGICLPLDEELIKGS
jgi:hypothetical protein